MLVRGIGWMMALMLLCVQSSFAEIHVTSAQWSATRDGCHVEVLFPRLVGMRDAARQHAINALLREQFTAVEPGGASRCQISYTTELLTDHLLSVSMRVVSAQRTTVKGVTVDLETGSHWTFKNFFRQGAPYASRVASYAQRVAARRLHEVPKFKTDFEDVAYFLRPGGVVMVDFCEAPTLAGFEVEVPYGRLVDLIDAFGPLVTQLEAASPYVMAVRFDRPSPRGWGRYSGAYPRLLELGTAASRQRVNAMLSRAANSFSRADDRDARAANERFTDRTVFKTGLATPTLVSITMDSIRMTQHGRPMRHYHNFTFDPRTGRLYKFAELFKAGSDYAARIARLVQRGAAAQQGAQATVARRNFADLKYYLTAENLVVIDLFDENVAADTEVAIPYDEIRDIVDPKGPLHGR